jgi:hypothetical protein
MFVLSLLVAVAVVAVGAYAMRHHAHYKMGLQHHHCHP